MTVSEIPLTPNAQTFQIDLSGTTYGMTVKWNTQNGSWMLDIADSAGNTLIGGLPLITGANLLEQHAHIGIGGSLYVQTDNNVDAIPAVDNLGLNSHLYFFTTP